MGEAKRRRGAGPSSRFEQVVALYTNLGIDMSAPGFFDDSRFLAAEKEDPAILETYGEFVGLRPYTQTETDTARRLVPLLADMVCEEVETSGRLGMCVDAAQLLGRCLDRLGIWNYTVVGAMSAAVQVTGGRIRRHFWVVDDLDPGAGQLGHVWITAPPFGLVDVTFAQQGWPDHITAAAPRFVLSDTITPEAATADDMVAPQYQAAYRRQFGHPVPPRHFNGLDRDYPAFARRFPGFSVKVGEIAARYFPTGIRAPDSSLETMFSGDAARFWNRRIVPALDVAPIG